MNETEIRVVFPRVPPGMYDDCTKFPTLKSSVNCPKPGICAEIIRAIALRQNLRIVPIVPPTARGDTAIGAYVNGTWVGMLGYLANGTADTVCLFYAETDFRRKHFDFSDAVYVPQNAFAVGRGKDVVAGGMWDFFDPYKLEMWLAMLLIFLAQCTIIFIAFVEYRSKKRARFEPGEVVWQLVRLQLRQVSSIRFYSDAGRMHMLVFAFMQCLLLLSLYQGWILSSLINHRESKPFSNMDEMIDLIARGKYRLVTNSPGHWFFELIQNSSKYNFIRLRNATERHPVVIVRNEKEAMDFVEHSNGIIPTQTDYTTMFESPCAISFVRFNIVERSAHFLFPKGSSFRAIFNEALDKERISVARLERRYFERPFELKKKKCERTLRKRMAMRPLQVSPYLGVLIVSAAGVCMAVLAFVLEQVCFCRR
ncbi:Protein W02A2.5 [Aphelenchoides avenae]|nr:Protein W02A2.5 [Aphelenchus avenae]